MRNLKKVLLPICGLLLFLGGCGGKKEPSYGIQPPIKGLSWGMSQEEVVEVLGDNYSAETEEEQHSEMLRFGDKSEVWGKEAAVSVRFFINSTADGEKIFPNLPEKIMDEVLLEYAAKDGESIHKEIEKNYGPSNGTVFGMEGTNGYSSKEKFADIEEEKIREYAIDLCAELMQTPKESVSEYSLNSCCTNENEDAFVVDMFAENLLYLQDAYAAVGK